MSESLERTRLQLATSESARDDLKAAHATSIATIATLEETLATERSHCQEDKARAMAQERLLQERLDALATTVKSLEAALEAARREVTLLSSSHKRAEETVSSLRADLETERATGVQRSDDLGASAAALEAARTEVADLLARHRQLEEEGVKTSAECSSLREENTRCQQELDMQAQSLLAVERRAADVVAVAERLERELQQARQEVADRLGQIAVLEQTVQEQEEKIIHERTQTLLGMISEKDARIAALEMMDAKKHRQEIAALQAARAEDLAALRDQFSKRTELLAAMNSSRDSLDRSQPSSSREELLEKFQVLHEDGERLRTYIDQLLAEVLKQSDQVSVAIMTGLPRMQQDTPTVTLEGVEELPEETIRGHLRSMDAGNKRLECYVNQILGRIVEHRPSILEVMAFSG